MKSFLKAFAVFIALNIGGWLLPATSSAQEVSFQVFYDNLSPYGQWVSYPNYGYVWVPDAGADFTPYGTNGHWVLTDDGWTWVSDYDWGWAPFHYGRWRYDNGYGWMWLPDEVWGPAWVSWRTGDGCYGWTPLGFGVGVGVAFYAPPERWLFCNQAHFGDPYISRYYLPRGNYATIYGRTTVINSTHAENGRTFYAGPDRTEVQRVTHKTFAPVPIRSSSRPGSSVSGGALNIYRPAVHKTAANGARPAPAKVTPLKSVKSTSQRTNQPAKQSASQHSISPLPNANRTQHTNVPINSKPQSKPQTSQQPKPQVHQQSQPQRQPVKPTTNYPSPYTVHPSTNKNTPHPAAQPQRTTPAPQRSNPAPAPQRNAAPVQHSAPVQRSVPPQQHNAPPPRMSSPPRQAAPAQERKANPPR